MGLLLGRLNHINIIFMKKIFFQNLNFGNFENLRNFRIFYQILKEILDFLFNMLLHNGNLKEIGIISFQKVSIIFV